jgi:hypothetical protein
MTQIALAEEPLEIAVARGPDVLASQRGPLVSVTLGVRHVTLLAMIAVEEGAGWDGVGPVGQRIGLDVVSGRDAIPWGIRDSARKEARSRCDRENRS